jgi:hypothetical protein
VDVGGSGVSVSVDVDVAGRGVSLAGTGASVGVKVDVGGRGVTVGAGRGVLIATGFSVGGTGAGVEPQPTRTINAITNNTICSGCFILSLLSFRMLVLSTRSSLSITFTRIRPVHFAPEAG